MLKLNVIDQGQIDATVVAAEKYFGRIDVLVNNAGIGYFAAVEEGEDSEVRRMFEINVFGLNRMMNAVLPDMRNRRIGAIVNLSSIGVLRSFPALGHYSATKFAVEGLSAALWQEVEPRIVCRLHRLGVDFPRSRFSEGSAGLGADPPGPRAWLPALPPAPVPS